MSRYKYLGILSYFIFGVYVLFVIFINIMNIIRYRGLNDLLSIIVQNIANVVILISLFMLSHLYIKISKNGYDNRWLRRSSYMYGLSFITFLILIMWGILEEFTGIIFFPETMIIILPLIVGGISLILSVVLLIIGYFKS